MTQARILIVEDEHIVALDIKRMLETLGYDVAAIASTGQRAVKAASQMPLDLALMDIRLKGDMDGIQAAEQIRSLLDIPVIYLTAFADDGTLARARVTEPFGYVLKPFTEEELRSAIEMALYKHQVERKLRESEMRFRALIENASDIIATLDTHGRLKYVSPAVERVLGYTPQELVGQSVLAYLHPEDLAAAEASLDLAGPQPRQRLPVVVRFRHRDGSWRVLEGTGHDRRATPAIQGIVINARDITERKRAEESLIQASRLEAAATLAGGVAHDLNNLMASVLGYAELLKAGLADQPTSRQSADWAEMLTAISQSAHQASDMAQQMLDFARVGHRQPVVLDVNNSVRDVLRIAHRSLPPTVRTIRDLDPDLWSVEADPTQIKQVLLNLFTNAAEAIADHGQIAVITRNLAIDADQAAQIARLVPGFYVRISVRDTGSGMTPETLTRAFEPFFSTKFQGRGMGLAAAYGIVQAHGGAMQLLSKPGQGTTAHVYLPALPQAEQPPARHDEASLSEPHWTGGAETLLVIEDDESVQRVLLKMLERLGYRLLPASGPQQAIDIADTFDGPIALALVDLEMPSAQCVDLVRQLDAARPGLRIVICSDYKLDAKVQAALQAGALAAIQKPFNMSVLAQEIRKTLDG